MITAQERVSVRHPSIISAGANQRRDKKDVRGSRQLNGGNGSLPPRGFATLQIPRTLLMGKPDEKLLGKVTHSHASPLTHFVPHYFTHAGKKLAPWVSA